jgi:hypothetical protein
MDDSRPPKPNLCCRMNQAWMDPAQTSIRKDESSRLGAPSETP